MTMKKLSTIFLIIFLAAFILGNCTSYVISVAGKTGAVTLVEADIAGLVTDLAATSSPFRGFLYGGSAVPASGTGFTLGDLIATGSGVLYTAGGAATRVNATATEPLYIQVTCLANSVTAAGLSLAPAGATTEQQYTTGILKRFSARISLPNPNNVRVWILFSGAPSNTSPQQVFSTNTPNTTYIGFRYSSSADTTWKLAAGTATANQTLVDSGSNLGIADTAGHIFTATIDGTNVNFFIDGTSVGLIPLANANMPANTVLMSGYIFVDNNNLTVSAVKTLNISTFLYQHKNI